MVLVQQQEIRKGSLVSVSVFPKTILYSPHGPIPVIKNYVAYGYEYIEDFFGENDLYTKKDLVKNIEEPFTGIVVDVSDYKLLKPHKVYSIHVFYKIFIDLRREQYWFSEKDVNLVI